MRRLDADRPESHSCFILCLRIISQLIRRQMQELELGSSGNGVRSRIESLRQETVTLFVNCLEHVSYCLQQLSEQDKEVFFTEVKTLIKIIKWNKEKYQQEK